MLFLVLLRVSVASFVVIVPVHPAGEVLRQIQLTEVLPDEGQGVVRLLYYYYYYYYYY